jgi:hypothetical protein
MTIEEKLPMETTQLIIIIVTVAITALLIILGIQVFYILKEMRVSLKKVNKMLDDAGRVTGTVGDSVTNFGGFMNGLKAGFSAIAALKGKKDEE